MATKIEPGQRSATLEPRTVRRAIAQYLALAHGVAVDYERDGDGFLVFEKGVTLSPDGSAHVTLHPSSPAFQRQAEETTH